MVGDGLFRGPGAYIFGEKARILCAGKSVERCPTPQFGFLTSAAMFKQREAIIRLLKDNDPDTVSLTKQQLVQGGSGIIGDLRDLLSTDDQIVTAHVREMLTEIEIRHAKVAFEEICERIFDLADLEEACWYLAQIFQPGVDIDSYQKTVDSWSRELRDRLSLCGSNASRALAIAQLFGQDLKLRGNEDDYYNARNSLLPCVMDSKLGIPISLSLLYMIVGRRASVVIEGINLPGHFVVRHGDILLDPFHEGRILTTSDCAQILSQQNRTLHQEHLQTAHPKLILIRMLANLLYIFQHEQNDPLHKMITQWIHLLNPA
jgi:regulator of sirC expression with transglutaminase-like and TPR domain